MFRNFMQGRYGPDALTYVLVIASAIFVNIPFLWMAGIIILAYALFRVLSRNTAARYKELQVFYQATKGIRAAFRNFSVKATSFMNSVNTRMKQRRTHVFFKRPKCRKTLRLPRNKGKLQVTCPVCKNEFIRKT